MAGMPGPSRLLACAVVLAAASACGSSTSDLSVGGQPLLRVGPYWGLDGVADAAARNLYLTRTGRPQLLETNVTRTLPYGQCVLYETQRTAPVRTVLASCDDLAPIEVVSTSKGRWHLYADGLRHRTKTTLPDGSAALAVELIPVSDVMKVAFVQPPFRAGAPPAPAPPGGWRPIRELEVRIADADGVASTALHSAATQNDVGLIEDLIDAGAAVDAVDERGSTALVVAAAFNRIDVVRALLDAGANASLRNARGKTALQSLPEFAPTGLRERLQSAK
jgi:hypothetical protein